MPFQNGHKLSVGNKGGGRKGYEFEEENLKRMELILDKYLNLAEKNKLTQDQEKYFKRNERFALKILDKIFANKLAVKDDFEDFTPPPINRSFEEAVNRIYGKVDKEKDLRDHL